MCAPPGSVSRGTPTFANFAGQSPRSVVSPDSGRSGVGSTCSTRSSAQMESHCLRHGGIGSTKSSCGIESLAKSPRQDEPKSWRALLTPVFVKHRYPGAYWRVMDGICAIGGRHPYVLAGAWGLHKRTGVDLRYVWRILGRLQRDGVLRLVAAGEGGRFPEQEKSGAPGKANLYAPGHACYPNGVYPNSGDLTTVRGVRIVAARPLFGQERTVVARPLPNSGRQTTPSFVVSHRMESLETNTMSGDKESFVTETTHEERKGWGRKTPGPTPETSYPSQLDALPEKDFWEAVRRLS